MKLKPILAEIKREHHLSLLKLQQEAIELDAEAEIKREHNLDVLRITPPENITASLALYYEQERLLDDEDGVGDDDDEPDDLVLEIHVHDDELIMFGPNKTVETGEADILEYIHNFCKCDF